MSNRRTRPKSELERMRLPELQARFREVTGETSRSPNRTFLIRRIEEAVAANTPHAAASPRARGRYTSMTVAELQAKYLEVVGRVTGSDDRRYLLWKIREAEKGRVPVGPRRTRGRGGEPLEMKILPLRLDAEAIELMDDAWRSRGIKSRMEFFRRALGHYLAHLGATDAAARFTDGQEAGG